MVMLKLLDFCYLSQGLTLTVKTFESSNHSENSKLTFIHHVSFAKDFIILNINIQFYSFDFSVPKWSSWNRSTFTITSRYCNQLPRRRNLKWIYYISFFEISSHFFYQLFLVLNTIILLYCINLGFTWRLYRNCSTFTFTARYWNQLEKRFLTSIIHHIET